jgi:DNA-binding NarL/FixJ family response regulator
LGRVVTFIASRFSRVVVGMAKKVALVGHCGPDSSFLRMAVSSADRTVQVLAADDSSELNTVLEEGVDLLLLNREMPYGFDDSEGVDLIRKLRSKHPGVKMMLVSNYPDAQAAAVAAGAVPGFGKREIGTSRVKQVLREALG